MIRLPKPPLNIGAPLPVLDYFNKFNEIIRFQQNLVYAIEIQQKSNNFTTSATTKKAEEQSEATSWFNA
jgi:hypothetical protein